jgi:hypothetical protein
MRKLYGALVVFSLLFLTSVSAFADVNLIKAECMNSIAGCETNQHRYEKAIKQMDSESDRITNQLGNHGRGLNSKEANSYGGMKVTLIRVRH